MKTIIFEDEKTKERFTVTLSADRITATPVGPGKPDARPVKSLTLRLNASDIPYSDNCILSERKIRVL